MRLFGLAGRSLKHSFSQDYFTRRFADEGITDCEYRLFEVPEAKEICLLFQRYPELVGLNVTIPYKKDVIPFLDKLDQSASETGAVNTIFRRASGELWGYNTDITGFEKTLRPLITPQTDKALVLGTGGASAAVCYVLRKVGVRANRVGRTAGQQELTYSALNESIIAAHKLIINTTPVGQYPDMDFAPDIPYRAITQEHVLIDLVYNPQETLFLRHGRQAGALTENGLSMLYSQADAAWQIWSGK
jgi:shikimate dehydrogenase